MSGLAWTAVLSGVISSSCLAAVVAFLGIRNGGLKADVRESDTKRRLAEEDLENVAAELRDVKIRAEAKIAALVDELKEYEEHELDGIEKEPDRDIRIKRRRSWVSRVLSKTSDPTGGDDDVWVRPSGTSD